MTGTSEGADAPTTVSIAAGPLVGPILRRVVGMLAAMYLDLGPFSRFVMSVMDRQIADIDSGVWQRPLVEDIPIPRRALVGAAASG